MKNICILDSPFINIELRDEIFQLEKEDTCKWKGNGINLKINVKDTADGESILEPVLENCSDSDIYIESLEIINHTIEKTKKINFLRFGFNMPGDPVFFGTLDLACEKEQDWMRAFSETLQKTEDAVKVNSNSLIVLKFTDSRNALAIGAASFTLSEGTVSVEMSMRKKCFSLSYKNILDGVLLKKGQSKKLDLVYVNQSDNLNVLLKKWAQYAALSKKPLIPDSIPTGWNDWQYYRNEKTLDDVLDSAEVIAELKTQGYPLDFVQVDGGFCMHLSEWSIPKSGFSKGIKHLSRKINSMGLKFGLWFAPYIQNINTDVVKKHPEWLLKGKDGEPLELKKSNVGQAYLIDYTHPGAIDWLKNQIRLFVDEWHVEWIKLDGPNYDLYRRGKLNDRSRTNSEMLTETFRVMRKEAGKDVLIEGEGMMGLALGFVDLHRVQTDNHPKWYDDRKQGDIYAPRVYGKELIMSFLHNTWWCNHRENVILRNFPSLYCEERGRNPHAIENVFTEEELRTQLTSAFMGSGGMLLTDPMKELARTTSRFSWISKLFPVYPEAAEIMDPFPRDFFPAIYRLNVKCEFDNYFIFALMNWGNKIEDYTIQIPDKRCKYHVFSFFEEKYIGAYSKDIQLKGIAPHDSSIVLLKKAEVH
ncbi:MAG: alpha-galactosidase, partial [Lentisphaerota bacterium]